MEGFSWRTLQYSHENGEPQLLGAEERVGIRSPFAKLDIVAIS